MKKATGIPVMLLACLLPLAVYFHIEIIELSQYPWFPNQGYWLDWFLYGKSCLVQILAILMAGVLLVNRLRNRKMRLEKENILLLILGISFVLSTFFSWYPKESLRGSIEQYESLGVLLGYVIICSFCYWYAQSQEHMLNITKALLIGLAISCILGFFQFLQMDFWSSDIGKQLLIPKQFAELRESLRFGEDAAGFRRVYMGLYNSSYAGIYLAMMSPLFLVLPKKYGKIMGIPFVICLLGTMSKTAWLSVAMILLLGIWIIEKPGGKKKKQYLMLCASVMLITCGSVLIPTEQGVLKDSKLQEVSAEEEYIRIVYQGNILYFSEYPKDDGVTYRVLDGQGKKVKLSWSEERGELDVVDPRFEGLRLKVYLKDNISYAVFGCDGVRFRFSDDLGTGKYEYISINGKRADLKTAKSGEIFPDALLNGRGYIWNRTIPLITENFMFGTGPDTFLQVFPQEDYVARARLGYGFFSEILTNAHSLYLQIALQNGVLTLILFIVLVGTYLRKAWKYYMGKNDYTLQDKVGIACFLGCTAYLLCGILFSSSICTTPFFMILFGTGMGSLKGKKA